MAGKSTSGLSAITSGWFLDYCVYLLWKEFKQKRAFSACWSDTVQDYLENKQFHVEQELTHKVQCIRFLIGLVEDHQGDNVASSQESNSEEQSSEDENEVRLLDCLKFFDKVAEMFPFSNAERSHLRSSLKLQIVLSLYRNGNISEAEHLFSRLYDENGPDEEYQDVIRELFQSENDALKNTFLRTHTYEKFLTQVQQFLTPVWKKFETPVLAESSLLENLKEERLRMDAKTLKALFFAWDQSEDAEQNWSAVVGGTHPDIKKPKNKNIRGKTKDTHNHITDKTVRQVVQSNGAASNSKRLSVKIQRCDELLKKLKASSKRLFSGLEDEYSDMIAEKARDGEVSRKGSTNGIVGNDDDDDDKVSDVEDGNDYLVCTRQGEAGVSKPESPNGKNAENKGKKPLERKPVKRRFNEEHSDAEIVEWESDDEIETKTIKLPSPLKRRCLNVKLPEVKHRKFWTAEETKWLEEGVKAYGEGNWTKILNAYNFVGRTSVNLKDRWRTLHKSK
ncbi:telomeric repeat-binding factor 2-like isoform X2 [Acropora millepora]|uniref:telomeric repeat-binding factor 2-like isoform X2 n=1 Tax=Acropora millepora TaxID=45264 RepID=UPI001CF12B8D|nr:telomeric repeat-binding factor 2-like isoform X2 [Acropora millepora]